MFRKYVCLYEKDIDSEFLEQAGIAVKKEENKTLRPRPCPGCHAINAPGAWFCPQCGFSLTGEAADEVHELEQRVLTDSEVIRDESCKSERVKNKILVVEESKKVFLGYISYLSTCN